jgi:hypothetical protein
LQQGFQGKHVGQLVVVLGFVGWLSREAKKIKKSFPGLQSKVCI